MKLVFLFFLCAMGGFVFANTEEPRPSDAKALGKELMNNLPGIFSLDHENQEKIDGRHVPSIRNGNWVLTTQPISLIDSFAAQTHSVATLFVKSENEFIRLMTTEVGEEAGTILDHAHPAYKRLIGELRYTDKITLGGKEYMADYDVFRDRQGRVIGAYLVAIPFL
ncbi:MAG: Cache 3/Cache 2 fusion domain-containing protein [Chlamydiota bacterium]